MWLKCSVSLLKSRLRVIETEEWNQIIDPKVAIIKTLGTISPLWWAHKRLRCHFDSGLLCQQHWTHILAFFNGIRMHWRMGTFTVSIGCWDTCWWGPFSPYMDLFLFFGTPTCMGLCAWIAWRNIKNANALSSLALLIHFIWTFGKPWRICVHSSTTNTLNHGALKICIPTALAEQIFTL